LRQLPQGFELSQSLIKYLGADMSTPLKKPWPLYFMALWAFFGIGSFLSVMSRSVFSDSEQLRFASLAVFGAAITLAYFLAQFNKKSLIVFGVLSVALAVFQLFNIAKILFTQGYNPIIFLFLYYLIPSLILAWPAFSKKYRDLSTQYVAYTDQEAMRKASLKAMRRNS
jgi:hypothetical protein